MNATISPETQSAVSSGAWLECRVKRCSKCHVWKSLESFHRRASLPDGRQRQCKNCVQANRKRYYQKHRSRLIAASSRWITENRDRFNANARRRWPNLTADERQHRNQAQRNRNDRLVPSYIRGLMRWPEAPPELVTLKTLQIKLHRSAV